MVMAFLKDLNVDLAEPFRGALFLIVVDTCSKWLEVIVMKVPLLSTPWMLLELCLL